MSKTRETMTPAIVLVHPQMGENIGAAARAMMNFGLSDLRIVKPRDGWPNEKAYSMASGASEILDNARICKTLEEAVADVQRVYATTSRSRDMLKPWCTPAEVSEEIHGGDVKSAILFGAERTGLTNDEVVNADMIITIPTHPENASLNIAQSIVIVAYEWFKPLAVEFKDEPKRSTSRKASPVKKHQGTFVPATKEEIQGFFDHFEQALVDADFFKSWDKKPGMWRNLKGLFTRTGMSAQDVQTMRGVIRAFTDLQKPKKSAKTPS